MGNTYLIDSLRTLTKSGSLIFCSICEKLVGSINAKGYRYIDLKINCSCGNYGSIKFKKEGSTSNPYERIGRMPKDVFGVSVCKGCGTPLFGIISERVRSYSFYVECKCGEKYDIPPTYGKRLGETLDMHDKMKKD